MIRDIRVENARIPFGAALRPCSGTFVEGPAGRQNGERRRGRSEMCDRTSNWRVVPEVAEHLINNSTRRLRWRHVLSPEGMFSLTPEWVENFRCWHVSAERREPKSFASSYLIGTNRLSPTGCRLTRREGVLLPESSCAASRDRGDSATPYRGARVAIFPTAPLQDLLLSRAAGARLMKGKEVGDSGCCSQSQVPTLGVVLPSWAWSPRRCRHGNRSAAEIADRT
jgi:hypothetical protein